jgi:hypothetical protein
MIYNRSSLEPNDMDNPNFPKRDWTDEQFISKGYTDARIQGVKRAWASQDDVEQIYQSRRANEKEREKERQKAVVDFENRKKTDKLLVNGLKNEWKKMTDYLVKNKYVQLSPNDNFKLGNIYWVIKEIEMGEPLPKSETDRGFLRMLRMKCSEIIKPNICMMYDTNDRNRPEQKRVNLNMLFNGTKVWEKRDTYSRFSGSKSASDFYKSQVAGKTKRKRRTEKSRKPRKGKSFKPTKRQRKTRRM